MSTDQSHGWDAVAAEFVALRTSIGAAFIRRWTQTCLHPGSAILDIGCGSGVPIAETLMEDGFAVSAIDASPRLIALFQKRFPDAPSACEAAEHSMFFNRSFDAAIAVGLIFLLPPADQRMLIARVARAIRPHGHFLFSAPLRPCEWPDQLTGRRSQSLGEVTYERLLGEAGFQLIATHEDEGWNAYLEAVRLPA